MGKAKTSRKGKKAWRANISTEDIEDFYEKATKDALSGGNLSAAPSEDLFHVEKSHDLPVKRKIEKHRERVLRCDSILKKNPFVVAVSSSKPKLKKSKKTIVTESKTSKQVQKNDGDDSVMVDLWGDDSKGELESNPRKVSKITSIIPAVEIEPPGCSYNPTTESHQDVLAKAVAQEMQKVYKTELGPAPVPLTIDADEINEDERYFLDVDDVNEDEDDGDVENEVSEAGNKLPRKTKRVTRVELNKRTRQKALRKKETKEKYKKKISNEIDSLSNIIEEIAQEDEDKQNKHLRKVIAKQDVLKIRPPRLGKHKFEAPPVQVLLTEEMTGSLRKLKACCTLARDRFKSLEKRGILVPSKNIRRN
ncbi:Ribosome biogenesis protein NOP53 [Cardamine amara subsp. amara]|uniref:Ribosome biogenesis protein NOP53 n=1 Tax=Cardamine amara subsp. amara TaxID=228776 RepID=A0ABD1BL17_CARAN